MTFLLQTFHEKRHRDSKNCFGDTALHIAAHIGSFDMAEALLEAQVDVNLINNWGATPLDVLYMPDPPFVQGLKEAAEKTLIENFEKGRNYICQILRDSRAVHNLPLAGDHRWADHLPFPWIREMRRLHS